MLRSPCNFFRGYLGVGGVDCYFYHSFQPLTESVIPLDSMAYSSAERVLNGFSLESSMRYVASQIIEATETFPFRIAAKLLILRKP